MGRTFERPNLYAGKCTYCGEQVTPNEGFVFSDHQRSSGNLVRHAQCNEATEARLKEERFAAKARGVPTADPWEAALEGRTARKAPTLDEAFASGSENEAFPEAEALQEMLSGTLELAVETIVERTEHAYEHKLLPKVEARVEELLAVARPVHISVNEMPAVTIARKHKALEDILLMVVAGTAPFLVGPAGSGKTTLAEQVAQVLGRKFYMAARVTSEYKLVGFNDAQGRCVRTQFREAYEHGGVFLFDEVDASDPDALTAFNAALANGMGDFPDGMVARHEDFVAIAAGNTFGRGADRQYVGRNQLDAATLDRFQVYEVDYDEELEIALAGNLMWTRWVQTVRARVEAEKVRHVVSPRASIAGSKLLAAGMDAAKVAEACVWKGMDKATRDRILNHETAAAWNAIEGSRKLKVA